MDQVAQIREKLDIVSYLSETMTLKKAGRNFKGLCPFHNEKSPSFMVSPERQMWHCFGCQKGGDIYTFLMEYEHIEFPEALRVLAKRAGIELVQSRQEAGLSSKREKVYVLNALASEYYHYLLTKHDVGKSALEYLKKRGLNDKIIETFQLGYAPSRNGLSRFLVEKKKYEREDLFEAGLAFPRGRDTVDFFRDRLMFPLIDHRDNIVGFSGRILTDDQHGPKYINTRETIVYHKGEHFYGLSVTKDAIRKAGQAILVEGEFDVISCFQEGITNVVAVKGTALTEQQVGLLGRYAPKLSICFDGDSAGQEAMKRSLPIIEKKGLQATVIVVPGGKDPDESLQINPGAFKAAVKKDVSVYDYLFEAAISSADSDSAEGKKHIADDFLPVIATITNEIIKEHYLRKLSKVLETTYESISKELARRQTPIKKPTREVKIVSQTASKRSREEVLEDYLLALVMQADNPVEAVDVVSEVFESAVATEKAYQKVVEQIAEYGKKGESFDAATFGNTLPKELQPTFDKSILFPLPSFPDAKRYLHEVENVSTQLRELYLRERIRKVSEQISQKEKDGDDDELTALKEEYSRLLVLLRPTH